MGEQPGDVSNTTDDEVHEVRGLLCQERAEVEEHRGGDDFSLDAARLAAARAARRQAPAAPEPATMPAPSPAASSHNADGNDLSGEQGAVPPSRKRSIPAAERLEATRRRVMARIRDRERPAS